MNGDPAELVGKTLGQRYRLERVIGAGGMGAVYEATQVDLGRTVAVKVLIDVDPRGIARLRQEAFAAGSSSCPHVISIFDFQTPPGEPPFIVMELLPGHSLAKLLERERSLPVPRAVRIAQQMLIALEAAHRAGVVHRDIKPSNTWLVHGPGVEEHVKLLDFGIAKVLGDGPSLRTTTGSVLGTPSYLSPEQLCGTPVDARTDIHAMGIVLFEMISGRRPWNPRAHVYGEIRDRVPPPLHEVAPHAPLELSHIVARALAKDPAGRFPRAADMRAALEPFVGQVVSSPATALGAALGTGTVGSSPGPYSATRDERGAYAAPVATAPMGGGAPTFQAPAVPHGVPATLTSTSQSLSPPQQPYAPPAPQQPLAPPPRSRSLALPFLLGGGVVILLGGLVAAAFVIGHYSASSSRSGASADPSAGPVAVSPDGGRVPASSAADAGAHAGAAAAAAADARKNAGGARSGVGAGGATGGGAPATPVPGAVTAASAAGPISPRCECENRNGGLICTTKKIPNCGCRRSDNIGIPICPVPWDATNTCPVRGPNDLGPYSAPDRKDGEPCSGFTTDGKRETGVTSCQLCYGRDKFAAVAGTPCSGMQMNGFVGEGKWVCEK